MKRTFTMITGVSALALSLSAVPTLAQDAATPAQETAPAAEEMTEPAADDADASGTAATGTGEAEVVSLPEWHPDITPETAWSTDALLEMDVYGPTGEEIGEVENVLLGTEGEVLSIVAEVGGVWNIGDTHVNVPWDEVEVADDRVTIPVTQETVEDYTLFFDEDLTAANAATNIQEVEGDGPGAADTGPRIWRATELVDDYVRLRDGDAYVNYGYVDDLIIRDGRVEAVVVRPDAAYGTRGLYAYPYYGYGYGWTPGLSTYDLPYERADIEELEPLDEEMWDS